MDSKHWVTLQKLEIGSSYLLTKKMHDETRSFWAQEVVSNDDLVFSEFLRFLETRVEALDAVNVPSSSYF